MYIKPVTKKVIFCTVFPFWYALVPLVLVLEFLTWPFRKGGIGDLFEAYLERIMMPLADWAEKE